MGSFHNYGHPARFDCFLYGDRDLFRKPLLDLEAATEGFCDSRELGKPKDQFIWDISYRNLKRNRGMREI